MLVESPTRLSRLPFLNDATLKYYNITKTRVITLNFYQKTLQKYLKLPNKFAHYVQSYRSSYIAVYPPYAVFAYYYFHAYHGISAYLPLSTQLNLIYRLQLIILLSVFIFSLPYDAYLMPYLPYEGRQPLFIKELLYILIALYYLLFTLQQRKSTLVSFLNTERSNAELIQTIKQLLLSSIGSLIPIQRSQQRLALSLQVCESLYLALKSLLLDYKGLDQHLENLLQYFPCL